jgi:hypothetical protein
MSLAFRWNVNVADVFCKLHSQGIEPSQISQLLGLPEEAIDAILRQNIQQ